MKTPHGSLAVVGIGPGEGDLLCPRAARVIKNADIVVGYTFYLSLIADLVSGKEQIATGMRGEIARATAAVEAAREGKRVCCISSGDAGIYGMAGLVLELLGPDDLSSLRVEIVPGITAASLAAGVLGAALLANAPFAVVHVVSNAVLFAVLAPVVLPRLGRLAARTVVDGGASVAVDPPARAQEEE